MKYVSEMLLDRAQAVMLKEVLLATASGRPMPVLTENQKNDAALVLAKLSNDLLNNP